MRLSRASEYRAFVTKQDDIADAVCGQIVGRGGLVARARIFDSRIVAQARERRLYLVRWEVHRGGLADPQELSPA